MKHLHLLLGIFLLFVVLLLSTGGQPVFSQDDDPVPGDSPLTGYWLPLDNAVDEDYNQPLLLAPDAAAPNATQNDELIANCRYGIVATENQVDAISEIGAGWYLKFWPLWGKPLPANDAEFVHVFKINQKKTADGTYLPDYETILPLDDWLADKIRDNPGDIWVIGNEVDRGPNPGEITRGQGDMFPEIYAQAFHEIRNFIKSHDPTARIAISALVEVTPGRLRYLDKVWNAYQQRYGVPMPVDVWNMHIYILPEVQPDGFTPNAIANVALGTDPSLGKRESGGKKEACPDPDVYCFAEHDDLTVFGEQVIAMRQWMKDHDQQQKPLILTEFSILYPEKYSTGDYFYDEFGNTFNRDRTAIFMTKTFEYLNGLKDGNLGYALDENRLVQQWLWFSMYNSGLANVSNILEADNKTLTKVGRTFKNHVLAEPSVVNLVAETIEKKLTFVDQSGKVSVPIAVSFRNNGNVAVEEPFAVTFYADKERTIEIGTVTVSSTLRGCATDVYTASVIWPDLPPGTHRFWVTVDSNDDIIEGPPGQQDNDSSGVVVINREASMIPIVLR